MQHGDGDLRALLQITKYHAKDGLDFIAQKSAAIYFLFQVSAVIC